MITSPHCDYISNWIDLGATYKISVWYIDKNWNSQTLPFWINQDETQNIQYLNDSLRSYGLFSIQDSKYLKVKLSENAMVNVTTDRSEVWGGTETVEMFQETWTCVELPVFSTIQAWNSISEEDVHDWAIVELVILGVVVSILTISILIKKI